VPNVDGGLQKYLDSAARELNKFSGEAAAAIAEELHLDQSAVAHELDALTTYATKGAEVFVEGRVKAAGPESAARLDVQRKAVAFGETNLLALLDTKHPEWVKTCGLERVTSPKDGCTEWVMKQHVGRFKEEGLASLGAATESGEERGAKAEAELWKLKQASPGVPEPITNTASMMASPKRASAASSACVVC